LAEALQNIAGVEKTAGHLAELTRALSALQTGDQPSPLDINSVLYEVWEDLTEGGRYDRFQMEWDLDFAETIPEVVADRDLLAEVFRLVLENVLEAIDHEPGHLRICTWYEASDDEIRIEIEDDGKGIPPQVLERLFMQPVPSKDDPARLGHGMGSWLVGLIVACLAGSIQILRTGIGQGTVVQIRLPAYPVNPMVGGEG